MEGSVEIITFSHGQATVERGFSTNKEVLTANMSEETLINRRLIKDYLNSVSGISEMVVTDNVITLGLQAKRRYEEHLERKKMDDAKNTKMKKRGRMEEELEVLIEKKRKLQAEADNLVKESNKAADKAEEKENMTFLIKSNAFRRPAADKSKEVFSLSAAIVEHEKKIDSMIV